jgi:hypothetical protein
VDDAKRVCIGVIYIQRQRYFLKHTSSQYIFSTYLCLSRQDTCKSNEILKLGNIEPGLLPRSTPLFPPAEHATFAALIEEGGALPQDLWRLVAPSIHLTRE